MSTHYDQILGGEPYRNQVAKLSHEKLIKFGLGVTKEEAENQRETYRLIDPNVLKVPRVHCFFSDDSGKGYIVMDHVRGDIIEPLEYLSLIKKITKLLVYFTNFTGSSPGLLRGGLSRGLLFNDIGVCFHGMNHMEEWFNKKLLPYERRLILKRC